MNSIAFDVGNEKVFSHRVQKFFSAYQVSGILKQCGAYKQKGFSVVQIITYLFLLVFRGRSMYLDMVSGNTSSFHKDTAYRLKNADYINWRRFTTMLSSRIIKDTVAPLTSEKRRCAFVIDDTIYERNGSKKVELLARVYDHAKHRHLKGFRMLTLGWSDGVTFLPVNACLLSSENEKSRIVEAVEKKSGSHAAKVREMAMKKATEVVPQMLSEAKEAGIQASYVLFDSWFSSPKEIRSVKALNLDVVAMVKKSSKVYYAYQGNRLSVKDIYDSNRKRRGRSRYLLSVDISLDSADGESSIPARLVFVRNRSNRKDYLVLISTDMELTEDEVIQLYGKRWDIEVFFKTSKSLLRLTKECRALSYDAMCGQIAIVFLRYMFLSVSMREETDIRTAGPMFCLIADELADISFANAFEKLQLFLQKLLEGFTASKTQIEEFAADFVASLPKEIAQMLALGE